MAIKRGTETIDLSPLLLEQLSSLYNNDKDSDIVFIIDGERIYAHKFVLTLRCEYFRVMFSSGLKESIEKEIILKETPLMPFKNVIKYIYTGRIRLSDKNIEDIVEILDLGHCYELHDLVSNLIVYLEANINAENVYEIYGAANLYAFGSLSDVCHNYLLNRGFEILNHDAFYTFNSNIIIKLFSDNNFCAEEIYIFKAIMKWIQLNPNYDDDKFKQLIATVRLPLISWDDLIAFVWPSGLFEKDELLAAIQLRNDEKYDNYRHCVSPIRSLESISHGVIEKTAIYRRPYECFVSLIFSIPGNVTIKFDGIRFTNYLEIRLGNCERSGYSYYIEAATDDGKWTRIADYTDFHCFSTQHIYFPVIPIEFLRIYGTRCNGGGTNFIIDSFKCMIREIPANMYLSSRNKSGDLDFKSENKNKCHAPLYARSVDINRSKCVNKFLL